jgi:heme exporter protein B
VSALRSLLRREGQLARAQPADLLLPLVFYVLVATLFALGTRPNDPALAAFAPAVLWVGALLAALLPLQRLFSAEFEDGTLEQWCLADVPLVLVVIAKVAAQWGLSGLPLSLAALPLGAALGLTAPALLVLGLGLLMGTAILTWLGALAASLAVGLPRAGALMPLLVLPLLAPVVIFGSGSVRAATSGGDAIAPLYFLGFLLALASTALPWACANALRNAFD